MLHKDRPSFRGRGEDRSVGVPPPPLGYFGRKSFYFIGLQVGGDCKTFNSKGLRAKYLFSTGCERSISPKGEAGGLSSVFAAVFIIEGGE